MGKAREDWEWIRIQEQPCPQCGPNPAHISLDSLGQVTREATENWTASLASSNVAQLRLTPQEGAWSPLQYALHVRDVLRVFGERIDVACREDDPTVPRFDPGDTGWLSHNQVEPAVAAVAIEGAADGFLWELALRADDERARTARRDGVDHFTVFAHARFGVHEANHHVLDATGRIGSAR